MGSPSGLLPAAPGTSRGQALKRSTAGQGIEAQEAALSPDSGLLEPAAVDAALTYNNKHAKRGAAWIGALQGFLGVGASASYDEPTVQGVAGFQSDKGLSVDGKIGTRTSSKLEKAGVEVQSSETPTEASGGAGGPGAAEDKSASPAPVAPVTTAATPTKEVAPGPAQVGASDAAPAISLREVKRAVKKLGAPPSAFGEGTVLDLEAFAAWAALAAAAFDGAQQALAQLGPDGEEDRVKLQGLMDAHAPGLDAAGQALRARAIALVNDSTLMKSPGAQPTLPDRAVLLTFGANVRRIGKAGGALGAAGHICQDAVLATQQGMSVLAARATLKERPIEAKGNEAIDAQEKRGDKDALNRVFRDSGFDTSINVEEAANGDKRVADWCGIFCASSMFRGGGIDEELRGGFMHTSNVEDYFNYTGSGSRTPKSIWADGEWHSLAEYHAARGSPRNWQTRGEVTTVMEGDGALDVRPGDIVLIDHKGQSKSAQHITMVESYDPATMQLTTIEGNCGGVVPDSEGNIEQLEDGQVKQNSRPGDTAALNTRDMSNMSKASAAAHKDVHDANMEKYNSAPKNAYKGRSGTSVFGIGRPSAVDFEEHEYATKVVPEKYAKLSPDEMNQKANAKAKSAVELTRAK